MWARLGDEELQKLLDGLRSGLTDLEAKVVELEEKVAKLTSPAVPIGDTEQRCSCCGSADLLRMGPPAEWGGSEPGRVEYWCRDCKAKTIANA